MYNSPMGKKRKRSPERIIRAKWAASVRKRDGYACQACGRKTSLQVHHVLPVSLFPLLHISRDNGITLCKFHHTELHRAQLELILAPTIWASPLPAFLALKATKRFMDLANLKWRPLPAHELLRVVVRNPQKAICKMYPKWALEVLGLSLE